MEIVENINKESEVVSLKERLLSLDHQVRQLSLLNMKLGEENKLLKETRMHIMDKYEMDEAYKIKRKELAKVTDEVNDLLKKKDELKLMLDQERSDLIHAREMYIKERDRFVGMQENVRKIETEYGVLRKKLVGDLPPLNLPNFEPEKKKGMLAKLKSKFRRKK